MLFCAEMFFLPVSAQAAYWRQDIYCKSGEIKKVLCRGGSTAQGSLSIVLACGRQHQTLASLIYLQR
jgi:hypothetical protein